MLPEVPDRPMLPIQPATFWSRISEVSSRPTQGFPFGAYEEGR